MPGRRAPDLRLVRRHCLIGRRLCFTQEWAADEERRELSGVPEKLCFATKPQLAVGMLRAADRQGISASFFLGDEVRRRSRPLPRPNYSSAPKEGSKASGAV
ncbi:transposase [Streptomyces sp. NPDC006668]|uniref:transposase n=1 Tax=Streptomyces sp. NPDC006668 TaxID=3156903 RepID=UPI0034093E94